MDKQQLCDLIETMNRAFLDFDQSIHHAQRMYHNYEDWSSEQWDPIDKARTNFTVAYRQIEDLLKETLNDE